jgi:hypothetical protein
MDEVFARGAAYAASRISSTLKGSTKQFGWLQASATRNCSAPMSSEYPATIRIDKNEGRIACLSRTNRSFESRRPVRCLG